MSHRLLLSLLLTIAASGCTSQPQEYCRLETKRDFKVAYVTMTDRARQQLDYYIDKYPETPVYETPYIAKLWGYDISDCESEELCLITKWEIISSDYICTKTPKRLSGSICNDGTYSPSRGRGACSHHGGVRY
jgi:hypothetical protein